MRVKIVDVAKEANVSVATVSRVVNNIPLVNQETRERVLEAIKRTGYKPNAIARSLKIQKTNTLGIIIPDVSNPFYTEIVRGAEDVCDIYNYNIILSNTDFDPEKERKSLDILTEKQCDGIIYVGKDLTDDLREELVNSPSEIVLGCIPDTKGAISSVLIDNEAAAYDLAKVCLERGHRKFLMLYDELREGYVSMQRMEGTKRALEEYGLKLEDMPVYFGNLSVRAGYTMMEQAIDENKDFTVALCFNDQIALGAIRAAEDRGKNVPEDLSVCGFNNFWISEWTRPEICTVAQPMYDIGAIATRMLIKKCEKEDTEVKSVSVPYELLLRDSLK